MDRFSYSICVSVGLLAGTFLMWEIGRRIALYRRRKDLEAEKTGIGAVEGAVFGLMGLMLAFSFSGAMTRWDEKRALVVEGPTTSEPRGCASTCCPSRCTRSCRSSSAATWTRGSRPTARCPTARR